MLPKGTVIRLTAEGSAMILGSWRDADVSCPYYKLNRDLDRPETSFAEVKVRFTPEFMASDRYEQGYANVTMLLVPPERTEQWAVEGTPTTYEFAYVDQITTPECTPEWEPTAYIDAVNEMVTQAWVRSGELSSTLTSP